MKSLSYRQKNQAMAVVAGVLLVVLFGVSVRKTAGLIYRNAELTQQVARVERAPEQIAQLQARSAQLGETIAVSTQDHTLRKELFEKVGAYCQRHQVRLESVQEAETFTEGPLQVETHELRLSGSFINQLRVCLALEEHLRSGRVASVIFRTERDRRTRQASLRGHLFIQGVKEVQHEKD